MNKISNAIIKFLKYLGRSYISWSSFLIWCFIIILFLNKPSEANWPLAIIITAILIYMTKKYDQKEEKYEYIKKNLKLLYKEYIRNITFSNYLENNKKKILNEGHIGLFYNKFMNKVIEEDMIYKFEKIKSNIDIELNTIEWYNWGLVIFGEGILNGNKNLKEKMKKHLDYNKNKFNQQLKNTRNLLKNYFEKEYNE